ncbi:PRC-barrel domain-containing protein [Methyloligella sp. 2.7D]|uniref:PRC-barrel domain-containing protein n=1 Tax=unclassified Methyloligella TaxID=2625955 RepID=UPI00157C24B4|nr:PRC-barrel domain-containing protein [Methyloligella sp. GL2]QKP77705.1 PRC-barrel domain-containing protein [Methyloligella sp. GL2]
MRGILICSVAGLIACTAPCYGETAQQEPLDTQHPTETMAQSRTPGQINGLPSTRPRFLTEQESGDWRAGDLIGSAVETPAHETVGEINDLVFDDNGRVVAAVVGVGGFLGIGEKNVALRFKDIRLDRSDDGGVTLMANVTRNTLSAAPSYRTLEQQAVVPVQREE